MDMVIMQQKQYMNMKIDYREDTSSKLRKLDKTIEQFI